VSVPLQWSRPPHGHLGFPNSPVFSSHSSAWPCIPWTPDQSNLFSLVHHRPQALRFLNPRSEMGSVGQTQGTKGMKQPVTAKVARGESTDPQDVAKRIKTQFRKLSDIGAALKGLERAARSGGDPGKLTFVLMASTSTACGVQSTVCFESSNILLWTTQEAPKLLEEAECGKWSPRQSAIEREEYARTSREMFPSYGAALQKFNLSKLRTLLRILEYDGMRDLIKRGAIPEHMEKMLSEADYYIFPPQKTKTVSILRRRGPGTTRRGSPGE
jgi:hypothetical protein